MSDYDKAREYLVEVFQQAWHRADERGETGHRTEAGMDAVLSALALAIETSSPIAWRQEYTQVVQALAEAKR